MREVDFSLRAKIDSENTRTEHIKFIFLCVISLLNPQGEIEGSGNLQNKYLGFYSKSDFLACLKVGLRAF